MSESERPAGAYGRSDGSAAGRRVVVDGPGSGVLAVRAPVVGRTHLHPLRVATQALGRLKSEQPKVHNTLGLVVFFQ